MQRPELVAYVCQIIEGHLPSFLPLKIPYKDHVHEQLRISKPFLLKKP